MPRRCWYGAPRVSLRCSGTIESPLMGAFVVLSLMAAPSNHLFICTPHWALLSGRAALLRAPLDALDAESCIPLRGRRSLALVRCE